MFSILFLDPGQIHQISDTENQLSAEDSALLPCQRNFKLKAEDEISLDSIFSALLSRIEPSEVQLRKLKWDLSPKDFLNEKNSILFDEKLYISQFRNNECKLNEETKIFMERELEEVGEFNLRMEESYDGYVIYGKSHMVKDKSKCKSGHWTRGKYDDKLNLICEKRSEYDYVDNARIVSIFLI